MRKKILIGLLMSILLLNITPVFASTKTFNRNEMDNYGVSKKWKITSNNKNNILRTPAIDASEKIYDFAEILTEEEETTLKEKVDEFIEKTNFDIAIVTADFTYYSDSENEDYAADFYDYNDFGIDYEKYSGVVFFRNANPSDPYYGLYTFGNAQLYFDNNRVNSILDAVYSRISSKEYEEGITSIINQLIYYYDSGKSKSMDNYTVDENGYLKEIFVAPISTALFMAVIFTIIIIVVLVEKNKMVRKATEAGEYLNKRFTKITKREDKLINSHTSSYTRSSSSDGGGFSGGGGFGGFSSSSGSSGGGHGGGGRHG